MQATHDLYPSRNGAKEDIIPRVDPVVYPGYTPDPEHQLNAEQLNFYEDNGYLILPDHMPEAVPPLRTEIERLKTLMRGREECVTEPDSKQVRTLFKPFAYSPLIDHFARSPEILHKVRQILGSDAYLMQSRINIKPAYHGRAFNWHSDFETWHVEDGMPRMRAVTVWLMLNDNHEHNGPLYVIPGSHKDYISCSGYTDERNYTKSLKKQTSGVPSEKALDWMLADRSIESIKGNAGTLVMHECNILHGSPDNLSDDPRSILMFVYNSCENRTQAPFSGQSPRPHYLSNRDQKPLQLSSSFVEAVKTNRQ